MNRTYSLIIALFLTINNFAISDNGIEKEWEINSTYQIVDNISQLQTLKFTDSGKSILFKVLGYYTPGDGGGGDFYFDPKSKEIANSGTIIKSNTTNGMFKRLYSGALNVLWFGVKRNVFEDQAAPLNKAIEYAYKNHDAVFVPNGMYYVKSTISIYEGVEFSGENMKHTLFKCDVPGDFAVIENRSSETSNGGRTSLSSFTINTMSRYGLLYTTDQKHYPFTASFKRIEVVANRKGNFKQSVAIKIEGLSHAHFDTVLCQSTGTAFEISGDRFNTGVMTFNNCFFGNKYTNRIGFHFANGQALDSYSFNACYFGGLNTCELIGNGHNTVVSATHNACHYENFKAQSDKEVGSSLIQFNSNYKNKGGYGASGFSWNNCIFGGKSDIDCVVKFNDGNYRGISFTGMRVVNVGDTPVFSFAKKARFSDCNIDGLSQFPGSENTFDDKSIAWENKEGFTWGWNVNKNGYYHLNNGVKSDERPVRMIDDIKHIAKDVNYNKGDIFYNNNPRKRKYIGWICVKSGTPGEWRRFGKIK